MIRYLLVCMVVVSVGCGKSDFFYTDSDTGNSNTENDNIGDDNAGSGNKGDSNNQNGNNQIEEGVGLRQSSGTALEDYWRETLKRYYTDTDYWAYPEFGIFGDDDSVAATAEDGNVIPPESAGNDAVEFSEANVQEEGVDELDRMRRFDDFIFLARSEYSFGEGGYGIDAWRIEPQTSKASRVGMATTSYPIKGLYKHQQGEGEGQQIIAIANGEYNYWDFWFEPYYFGRENYKVHLGRYLNSNGQLQQIDNIAIDGTLISSRKINNHLYLILRYFPYHENMAIPHPYPNNEAEADANSKAIDKLNIKELLPKISINGEERPLYADGKCFLNPYQESDRSGMSLISIVHIDLAATDDIPIKSVCFSGQTRLIYASQQAVYLASSRYNRTEDYVSSFQTTEIHRFPFMDDGTVQYQGSGQVLGSVGWDARKAAFQFAERQNHLAVVTELAQYTRNSLATAEQMPLDYEINSNAPSPVLLSVLSFGNKMERVAQLPNAAAPEPIGKPNEDLYGVRFTAKELYLVTFRKTDPLYRVDLSDVKNPTLTGELEITGFSDYLHPVADNLILGVGKEAIPVSGQLQGDANFSWFQGVKLSLFSVDDEGGLTEVDKDEIGRRGSQTPALSNHHAFAWLNSAGEYRIAIPVEIHETACATYNVGQPNYNYDWTRTALQIYGIDIERQKLSQVKEVVAASASSGCSYSSHGRNRYAWDDRSILSTNGVFYIHQNEILTDTF